MEFRLFQIIIPLFACIIFYRQFYRYKKSKSGGYETILIISFWLGVVAIALFPDYFSKVIASIFGFKDNVNAVIFFSLGLLFYFQFKLYRMIRRQDKLQTDIIRKIAIDNPAENKDRT